MAETAKIALVTGGGSGIGRAAAKALLSAGWTVVVTGRRQEALDETLREAGAGEGQGLAMAADVADAGAVEALFAEIEKRFGRLDLLFNNAGTGSSAATIDEIPVETFRRVIDVNVTGSFLCARAAFALMRRQRPQGGRIVNNGSISAHAPRVGSVPYTTSKHAITGLTKTLALDGRAFDIACGQIDIGNAATELATAMVKGVPQASGLVVAEPTMAAEEVGEAILHMASLPLSTNVLFMTIMATKMPFVGRG
ncbi:SDR family oxidoreductase [Afifella pfennigii]|uniref:SDR family oxidoreductase n=1 Tax=Afifella pfennigii TaxID=209897 RepID=UPI00047D16BD|nr:SDR family oxidoreductase [Afifella pfennigii]